MCVLLREPHAIIADKICRGPVPSVSDIESSKYLERFKRNNVGAEARWWRKRLSEVNSMHMHIYKNLPHAKDSIYF